MAILPTSFAMTLVNADNLVCDDSARRINRIVGGHWFVSLSTTSQNVGFHEILNTRMCRLYVS